MKAEKAMLSVGLFIFRLAVIILVIVGVYKVGEYSYLYCYSIVADTSIDEEPGKDVAMTLSGDMSVKEASRLLEKKGLIKDSDVFYMQLKIHKYNHKILPGSYMLNTSMKPTEIMKVLSGEELEKDEEE